MDKQTLNNYYHACNDLADEFAVHYFGKNTEQYWVAEEISGVCEINDYFFGMREMSEFFRYKYTRKDMFEYKEKALECYGKKDCTMICIRDWKKINN